jgi:chromosome segregation ATPase
MSDKDNEVAELKVTIDELNWGLKQSEKELNFKDEHIKKLKNRIDQLENPSDGRCMEIGALRERNKLMKQLLSEARDLLTRSVPATESHLDDFDLHEDLKVAIKKIGEIL